MKLIKVVKKVERISVSSLAGMTRISKTEVRLPSGLTWQPLNIKPHAQLSISDRLEDGNTIWTAKLVFKTCEDFGDRDRWAYRVTLLNGQQRLIGSDKRPYPIASVVESMPENVTDNQLNEVTVSWQSPHFILAISQ